MKSGYLSISSKKEKYKKVFLTNAFYAFALAILLFEIIFSVCIYYFLSYSQFAQLKALSATESNRIENTLKDVFSETHQVMVYVGKQISLYGKNNPQFIEKMLTNSSELISKIKMMYSWSLFDWVDLNNHVTVNSQIGIVRNSSEQVHDSYIWKCPKLPWTLQLSHPTIGNTSGMWTIPAGVGITDKNNVYLGTLNVGFNIAELNNKLQQALTSKESSFVVLDDDLKIVLQSADNTIDPKSSYYRDLFITKEFFKDGKAYLENSASYKHIEYTFYKKMEDFPYVILTGFDNLSVQRTFWSLILPRLMELYGLGGFCLGLLYFLRRKMFKLAKISETARDSFLQRMSISMKESVSSILTHSNILLKSFTGETKLVVTRDRQIKFIEKIYKEALDLYTMTSSSLNMGLVDIKELIKSSIDVQTENFLKKNITIKQLLAPALFPFYGDELRLKQIITSLLFLAIEYSPKGSTIKVSAINETTDDNQNLLIIKIEDNGFSLTAEDIMRLSEKFSSSDEEGGFMTHLLDYSSIEKLVALHNGTCYISNTGQQGKIIEIILPYRTTEELEETGSNITKPSNIYWLSKPVKSNP